MKDVERKAHQLVKEATWLLSNFFKAETDEGKKKWLKKWRNWQKAHPDEAEIVDGMLLDLYEKKLEDSNVTTEQG